MTEQEQAKLQVKIANEEYGKPDCLMPSSSVIVWTFAILLSLVLLYVFF